MKVRITKNNDENYWYNDRIGEVFEVEDTASPLYYRASGRYQGCHIDKDDCEIIKENPLEGADKLSDQIITTSEWAKMPQVKQEDKMKEYVLNIDFITLKKGDSVLVGPYTNVHTFENGENKIMLAIPNSCLQLALGQGIIAEKKSKAEEILDNIKNSYENNVGVRMHLGAQQIILEELEKAGIE